MRNAASTVLKRKAVKMAGRQKLRPMAISPDGQPQHGPPAKATVVKQADGYLVIQVECSCGQKVQLRCTYADQLSPPPDAPRKPEPTAQQAAMAAAAAHAQPSPQNDSAPPQGLQEIP
jgi:hypothetical protein